MKKYIQKRLLSLSLILISALTLSACGGGGTDGESSSSDSNNSDTTDNNTPINNTTATFPQATSNATALVVPTISEECKTQSAKELANIDPHSESQITDTVLKLLIKCSAETKVVYEYEQSLLPSSRFAARTTPIAPLEGLINFESPHVHPIDITPNGNTLVSVNTAAHTLEVWNINGSSISSVASIPVGLDPVSVRARNNNEVWVVNHISDSVSIVDLNSETVIQTLKTQNEPSDIVFAGSNRAFVSVSEANSINVFNLNNLNADPTVIRIAGEEPRSLGVSSDGNTVYAGIYESGNGTTFSGSRGSLAPIVRDDNLMDNDVAIINSNTLEVTYRRRLLNMVMAIGVNPSTQQVFAVGTEAANIIQGEPALKGKFITVNTARFIGAGLDNATITDLNPHLDYTTPTVSTNLREQSLGDPRSIVWQQNGQRAFIAGMGSNNIAVIDSDGGRIAHFDVGEGPTGIALKDNADIGFVMNKFSGSISVIDLNSLSQISEVIFDDPTPQVIKEGRPFIYDTHLTSGTGHTSCASCHVDSRTDRLAWQLSDENNTAITIPVGENIVPGNILRAETIRSNKGLMVTQTLLDIIEHPRFHWRGDKESIDDFNGTYVNLMGRESEITQTQMDKMKAFLRTLWLPPNPYRNIDNSQPTTITLPDGSQITSAINSNQTSALRGGAGRDCLGCHSGQGNATRNFAATSQQANFGLDLRLIAPAFPGYYDKIGFSYGLSGFGFFHDGTSDFKAANRTDSHILETLTLEGPEGPLVGDEVRQAPHAGVGQQVTINSNPTTAQLNRLDQLISIANNSSWAELIAHSKIDGSQRGFALQQNENFNADAEGVTATKASLLNQAADGNTVTFTIVARGMSTRLALDSDLNGILNADEDGGNTGSVETGSGNSFTPIVDGNIWEWSSAQSVGYDGNDITIANTKADILEAWVDSDNSNFYIAYFNDGAIDTETWWPWQVYIDTDGNASTGYQASNGLGAEYILEGADLLRYTGSGSNWSWSVQQANIGLTNGGAEAEFSISRQAIGNPESVQLVFSANNSPFTGDSSTAGLDLLPNSGNFEFNFNTDGGNSGGGSSDISNRLTPTLNGDLSEWTQATSFGIDGDDISVTGAQADWLEAWMAHDDDYLYLAYTNDGPINYETWWPWQTYMDTDNNPNTGFQINGLGADFIIEGGGVARYIGDGENWSWDFIQTSLETGKAESQVEIRIPRSVFGNLNSFKLSMSASNVAFTNDFSSFGQDQYQGTQAEMEYNASP